MDPQSPTVEESSALEQFRQQWREEVSARTKQTGRRTEKPPIQTRRLTAESSARPEKPINRPPARHPLADIKHDEDGYDEPNSTRSGPIEKIEGLRVRDIDEDDFSGMSTTEPTSALEHYERAVEKESQGNLGDSLVHYRKAYRLDAKVDQTYKNKHFPARPKPTNTINAPDVTVQAVTESGNSQETGGQLSFSDLIASYAELEIPNAEPIIKGDVPPPCVIKRLPAEVLYEVLTYVAVRDPAIFARLALVCRRLAYHVFSEKNIWKRLALGDEFGLASQQYKFITDIQGREAIFRTLEQDEEEENLETQLPPVNETLFDRSTDWRELFHSHPRIRFTGVYISTVNYTRAGGASAIPGAWHSSVHIVTYYRYLRFFRDGTVISLLTVHEPVDVVHHLTKENIQYARSGGKDVPHVSNFGFNAPGPGSKEGQSLPPTTQNIMKLALKGRWRLCHPSLTESTSGVAIGANMGVAGDLHIETEGVGPRYMYTLHLSIKSGTRSRTAAKNNKLIWKGFWSYNHLTDDWSEFQLRNDKAFWFSRVKSYGLGH